MLCCWIHLGIGSDQAAGQINAEELSLAVSGRVHRVVMLVEDGASWNGFFMDSEQGFSMLRADAHQKARRRLDCLRRPGGRNSEQSCHPGKPG